MALFYLVRTKKLQNTWVGKKYTYIMGESLYRNSVYLMINTVVVTGLGFFFWLINTRLFTAEEIGLATSVISVMGVITGISVLGLNIGLIRFLPKSKKKNEKINASFMTILLSSIVVSSIFLALLPFIAPELMFLRANALIVISFVFFMFVAGCNLLIDSIFTAFRTTKHIIVKNAVFSVLKLVLPFFLVFLGAYGIFSAWMISLIAAVLVSISILMRKFDYVPKIELNKEVVKDIGGYSFGNYVAGFISGLPLLVLPLLVLNQLGAESAAYYYIAMMIAALLFVIPQATSQNVLAEGSYSEKGLREQITKASKIIAALLLPSVVFIIFFGKYLLLLFGGEYSEGGFELLQLLALSGMFVAFNAVFTAIFQVQKRITGLLIRSIVSCTLTISLAYVFIAQGAGLVGIGYAWIVGQVGMALFFVVMHFARKNK